MKKFVIAAILAVSGSLVYGVPSFTVPPSMVYQSSSQNYNITFTLSESTDVEVAIVSLKDSSIVRHLAAGVLGSNPPAPLVANSLSQTIIWDGKDDFGRLVSLTSADLKIRVRAGMQPVLNKMVGGNHGFFVSFSGLVVANDGSLFIKGGNASVGITTTRQFDGNGNYIRTVYPYPSSKSLSSVSGFGVNSFVNGLYSPKNTYITMPSFTNLPPASGADLLPIGAPGELVYGDLTNNQIFKMNSDGTLNSSSVIVPLVSSPKVPYWRNIGGPLYATISPDAKTIYMSGIYEMSTVSGSVAVDTGFWKEGCIYKVDAKTGIASKWISLDSVPTTFSARQYVIGPIYAGSGSQTCAAFHGVALDDSGHVFVCDRLHSRVSVYDTNGTLLGSVSVKYPDMVSVNKKTGALYVTNRIVNGYHIGYIKLYKFAGWRNGESPLCSLTIATQNLGEAPKHKMYMGLSESGAKPVLWLSNVAFGVQAYQDDGNVMTKIRDFSEEANSGPINLKVISMGVDKMIVDRKRETVYFNNGYSDLFKIDNWTNPAIRPCSTSAGYRMFAGDFAISRDDQLYIRQDNNQQYGMGFSGPIMRYTLDKRHAPLNFPNTGKNMLTPYIYGRYKGGAGYGDHGIAIAPDKRVASCYMWKFADYFVGVFPDSGCSDTGRLDTLLKPLGATGYHNYGGLQYDSKGNLYFGATIKSKDHVVPSGFATDYAYTNAVGSVIRYPAATLRGSLDLANKTAPGSDRIYKPGFGPFSNDGSDCCQCRTPRFDIDLYDRLFIPNAITNQVTVTDNNDNVIAVFGSYGNVDQKGSLDTVSSPAIPLGWPVAAAASDNYIYVSDMVNTRIVRVKMQYALDNLPSMIVGATSLPSNIKESAFISATPNPFSPKTMLIIPASLSKGTYQLLVYDIKGKLVKDLTSSVNSGRVMFNGEGLAIGTYVVRLKTAHQSRTVKLSLIR
ncbi:MAG: T9SS type A sorting domain-containing protein [Fibrobacteres bacterium]|nr:T9SS type A sorting domain-containing protein [Fibrobacterota bacterium]